MKQLRFILLILTVLLCSDYSSETRLYRAHVRMELDPKLGKRWILKNGHAKDSVATIVFDDRIDIIGWSYLRVVTNGHYSDEDQAYAAGLLEGRATCRLMQYRWVNVIGDLCKGHEDDKACLQLWRYLHTNKNWMEKLSRYYARNDSYWHQVGLILKQLEGLQNGCRAPYFNSIHHVFLKDFTFPLFSLLKEVHDLKIALTGAKGQQRPGSCSALIKRVQGDVPNDLYIGHVTWDCYSDMLRILKNYEFYFHRTASTDSSLIPGYNMTFSSYPGSLHSADDFYQISSGLVTLQTSLEVANDSLWKFVSPKDGVPEFIRSMVANRLANDGREWTQYFKRNNSGTCNNQWMIVDYKKVEQSKDKLKNGTLWVIEQLPGFTKAQDLTHKLRNQEYWPSYSIPYFSSIYNLSGHPQLVEKHGDFFSYENNSRALMFSRDKSKVVDMDEMYKLLRSNDYLRDNLSICNDCSPSENAMLALSGRGDLNPDNGTYPLEELGHMPFGAIDLKMTNGTLFRTLGTFMAVSGPPYGSYGVNPFQWSKYKYRDSYSHAGHPDWWEFKPVMANWYYN